MSGLVGFILVFSGVAIGFVALNLTIGQLIRPHRPDAEKETVYECGEPTIGDSQLQFDLRFYVVALMFVVFDVEMAFFFPWAVMFGQTTHQSDAGTVGAGLLAWLAFADIVVFFGLLLVGFAYLWRRGDLEWVRSMAAQKTE